MAKDAVTHPAPLSVAQRTWDTMTAEVNRVQEHYARIIAALDREFVRVTGNITDSLNRAVERAASTRADLESPVLTAYRAGLDNAQRAYDAIAGPALDMHDTQTAQAQQAYAAQMGPVQQALADDLDAIKIAYENLTLTAPPTAQ
jgi:hypothetical protein